MAILHFKKLGEGDPIVILHGLFGMLDNWMGIAKKLCEKNTVYLLDARNHGKSFHSDKHSYEEIANDLFEFMQSENLLEAIFIGHSMGGKGVMKFAQYYPDYVSKLIVVDIGPKFYPTQHDAIVEALTSIPIHELKSRTEVKAQLSKQIHEEDVLQFLLKSVYWKEKDKLSFRFNIKSISKNIENIGEETSDRKFEGQSLFISGSKSNYIKEEDYDDIKLLFPKAEIKKIKAGHWVHAENPRDFILTAQRFIET